MQRTGFLGIDVSKGYADFLLLDEEKKPLGDSYKLYDTSGGHRKMYERAVADMDRYGLDSIICGVESTGGYENNWYNDLLLNGPGKSMEVVRLNPRGVKHQGASKMTRTVTDKVSAGTIAHQLVENKKGLLSTPRPGIGEGQARRFYHYITTLKKQRTALCNQLEKLVYNAFPEALAYAKNGYPDWLLLLLCKYPGHAAVAATGLDNLLKVKGLTLKKAGALRARAADSIGLEDVMLNRTMAGLAGQVLRLGETIKGEKEYLKKNYTSPGVELLVQIDGIAEYTAIGAVMEIEDVHRFGGAQGMACFFGVHPVYKKSGDGQWKAKMSKQGSSSFRALMYMGARNVVVHNGYFKEIYAKFRARGMNDGDAIGVVMHKLTRVFYGVLKSGKPFDPEVDRKNRQKASAQQLQPQTEAEKKVIEREMEAIKNAPCSNRAYRRKKAELKPQTSDAEVSTRSKILPGANI